MARETDDTHLTRAPAAEDTRSDGERAEPVTPRALLVRRLGLAAGVLLAVTVYLLMPGEVPHPAKLTAATAVLMAVWWKIGRASCRETVVVDVGDAVLIDKTSAHRRGRK